MKEIIRWPTCVVDNNSAKLVNANIRYVSWSMPPYFTTQIVNLIFMPATAVKILACRMMIVSRTGTTSNPCRFTLRIIDANTGTTISQLPTSPAQLNPMNGSLFPLITWQTVYQAVPASAALVVNTNEYFGVIFTGVAGSQSSTNNLEVTPLIEVLLES